MDQNADGLLNFRQLAAALGLTCNADITQRLMLLYLLHLPPLLTPAEIESPTHSDSGPEVAAEATDFFDSMEQSVTSLESFSSQTEESSTLAARESEHERPQREQSWEVRSMESLRCLVEPHDSRPDLKSVPRMSQPHFIVLWKTLYDLFQSQPEDLETFHSISAVGTLLFKLGDVGKRFYMEKEESADSLLAAAAAHWPGCQPDTPSTDQSPDRNGNPGCGPDPHWSITVEQFVATLLTSQPIVDFFGRPASLSEAIMKMRGRRFNRLHSLSDTAFVKV